MNKSIFQVYKLEVPIRKTYIINSRATYHKSTEANRAYRIQDIRCLIQIIDLLTAKFNVDDFIN